LFRQPLRTRAGLPLPATHPGVLRFGSPCAPAPVRRCRFPAFSFLGSPMPDNPALPAPKNLDIPLLFFLQALF